mmetsp:Transcript_36390/g.65517  ORF Transcript_36390/g.65517 Transcript_36390/m.65517 type:complete len:240 (-) Transcript_36390:625-1344(-)
MHVYFSSNLLHAERCPNRNHKIKITNNHKITLNPNPPSHHLNLESTLPVPTPQNPAQTLEKWHGTTSPDCPSCYTQIPGCPRCRRPSRLSMPQPCRRMVVRLRPLPPREESIEFVARDARGQWYAMVDPLHQEKDHFGEDLPSQREAILLLPLFPFCFYSPLVCHASSWGRVLLFRNHRRYFFRERLASSLPVFWGWPFSLLVFWGWPSSSFLFWWRLGFFLRGHWIGGRRLRGSECCI